MASSEERKPAHDWLNDHRGQRVPGMTVGIIEATGWRLDDGVTMDTPITLEEFHWRLDASARSTQPNGCHNPA